MEIIHGKIEDYIHGMSSGESEVLKEIARDTFLRQIYPSMISGSVQGKLLEMFSRMICPECILEIGTFTAYSTVCLAQGLKEKGHIITIEKNAELEEIIKENIHKAGIAEKTKLFIGDAINIIPKLSCTFDLVFIDGDKEQYPEYFQVILPFVRSGGFILADNVLWGGKVVGDIRKSDKETNGITVFNQMVIESEEVENVIIPVRDGISVIRKK
jgi:predicted O-methyltransferase YrrM